MPVRRMTRLSFTRSKCVIRPLHSHCVWYVTISRFPGRWKPRHRQTPENRSNSCRMPLIWNCPISSRKKPRMEIGQTGHTGHLADRSGSGYRCRPLLLPDVFAVFRCACQEIPRRFHQSLCLSAYPDFLSAPIEKSQKHLCENGEGAFSHLKPALWIIGIFDPDGFDEIPGPDRTLDRHRKNADQKRFERLGKVHIEDRCGYGRIHDGNKRPGQP